MNKLYASTGKRNPMEISKSIIKIVKGDITKFAVDAIVNTANSFLMGGSAVYVAIISALYKKNLKPGLAVLGNISIGGAVERSLHFADKVT